MTESGGQRINRHISELRGMKETIREFVQQKDTKQVLSRHRWRKMISTLDFLHLNFDAIHRVMR